MSDPKRKKFSAEEVLVELLGNDMEPNVNEPVTRNTNIQNIPQQSTSQSSQPDVRRITSFYGSKGNVSRRFQNLSDVHNDHNIPKNTTNIVVLPARYWR